MAAEFVLTFAAEGILTKVSSLAANKIGLAWGFHTELEKLRRSLSNIQDFLGSAADQRLDARGTPVEKWVKKLKQVAEDADDVLDEFEYELLRTQVELRNHMKRKVLNFLSASNPLWFRFKMAHKIKKINDSLVELKNEAPLINLVAKKGDSRQRPDRVQTDSFFEDGEKVVGRKDAVTKIVTTLISSDNQQKNLSVMAIVGMAGLGKTTLAKSVYNEPAIGTYFHKRIWVCVSNTFEVDTILSQMVDSLVPGKAGMKSQDALLKVLREEVTGKRYVLVLDDVWNEDREKWDSLMSCLSKLNSNPGSCIIVTTRSTDVSTIAETLPRPELRNLSEKECWSIIKQRALNLDENGFIDAELERIGMAIAKKCGGVPLVAKVLGSLLRSRASKDKWLSIRDNRLWDLPEGEDRIMKVLKLSFDNLEPSPLKQCFAYCSMLRKDFEIERDNLIQLWMAQGLLQTSTVENHHEMEHTGEVYFNILLNNSLFQEVIEGGNITKYTMHDLVHDLAEKVSESERLTQELNDDVRHVARCPPSTLENMSEVTVGRLRSLFSNDKVPEIIFSKFKAMRVLSLDTAVMKELPNSFGKLKHLRYLDLSKTRIKALPKSIGKLYNIQTLRMQKCDLNKLPREMQNLINLRHLYVDEKIEFPAGMFRGLTNLRTLSCFNVGDEMGCRIEELGGLNQLKGTLTIRKLENAD
ncbi:PREDICTED: putative disease resistance protein RGA3-like [Fragaria vesca subsp. vesca]